MGARVRAKYVDVVHQTQKATYFLLGNEKLQWIPNAIFRFGKKGKYLEINKEFCEKNNMSFTELVHIPAELKPKFNQEAINDLKFDYESVS